MTTEMTEFSFNPLNPTELPGRRVHVFAYTADWKLMGEGYSFIVSNGGQLSVKAKFTIEFTGYLAAMEVRDAETDLIIGSALTSLRHRLSPRKGERLWAGTEFTSNITLILGQQKEIDTICWINEPLDLRKSP